MINGILRAGTGNAMADGDMGSQGVDHRPLLSLREAAAHLGIGSDTLRDYAKRASDGGAAWPRLQARGWAAPLEEWVSLLTPGQLQRLQLSYAHRYPTGKAMAAVEGAAYVAAPVGGRCPRRGQALRQSRWVVGVLQGTELTCLCGYSWSILA